MRIPSFLLAIVATIALATSACSGSGATASVADTLPGDDSGTDTGTTPSPTDGDDVAVTPTPDTGTDPSDDPSSPDESPRGGTVRIGIGEVDSFDPAEASLGSRTDLLVADLLFDGLTAWDADAGELVPALARSWESADDGAVWTFELDPDAVFSDGAPVTAGDVKRSLERLVDADGAGLAATRLETVAGYAAYVAGDADEIAGLVVVDDATLRVELSGPLGALPWILASPVYGVVPAGGPGGGGSTIGSGPWVVDEVGDGEITLLPDEDLETLVEAVVLVTVGVDDAVAAVTDGSDDLDLILVSREAALGVADVAQPAMTLVTSPFHAHIYLGLGSGSEDLDDPELRAAIVAAVDTAAVVDEAYGPAAQAIGGLVPGSDVCDGPCGSDPDVVDDYLAGLDGDVPEITIDYIDDDDLPDDAVIARLVADQLIDAGFPVRLRSWDSEGYVEALAAGELEVFRFGWVGIGETPEAYVGHYESGGLDNLVRLENGTVDVALAAARGAASPEDALAPYTLVEEAVVASSRVLPFAEFVTLTAVAADVQGLTVRTDGTFDVSALEFSPPPGE